MRSSSSSVSASSIMSASVMPLLNPALRWVSTPVAKRKTRGVDRTVDARRYASSPAQQPRALHLPAKRHVRAIAPRRPYASRREPTFDCRAGRPTIEVVGRARGCRSAARCRSLRAQLSHVHAEDVVHHVIPTRRCSGAVRRQRACPVAWPDSNRRLPLTGSAVPSRLHAVRPRRSATTCPWSALRWPLAARRYPVDEAPTPDVPSPWVAGTRTQVA
jgi:hypothetical protein